MPKLFPKKMNDATAKYFREISVIYEDKITP